MKPEYKPYDSAGNKYGELKPTPQEENNEAKLFNAPYHRALMKHNAKLSQEPQSKPDTIAKYNNEPPYSNNQPESGITDFRTRAKDILETATNLGDHWACDDDCGVKFELYGLYDQLEELAQSLAREQFRAGQLDCRENGDPRNHKYFPETLPSEDGSKLAGDTDAKGVKND